MNVNRVILVGRLGGDPETRHTGSGQAVCNFSIATDESYKDRNGERQKRTEWHRVVAWQKLAEVCQQWLQKGALVYIEGRIQSRDWEKDGEKRTSFEIVARQMQILGGGRKVEDVATEIRRESAPATQTVVESAEHC